MLNRIYHLGYAVEDIEAASRFYSENFGVEPGETEVVEEQGVVATTFRVGESMVELVQPTRPDSPVGRFLERRGDELVDEEPRVGAGGTRVAFVHPKSAFGVLTELVELPGSGG
jgi:catechol 2,3-dioxygenase-like lactoylglutathione lyase family enzyme